MVDASHERYLTFSPDGRLVGVAAGGDEGQVLDVNTMQPISKALKHLDRINHIAFSPDGTLVVTASKSRTAKVWNACDGSPRSPQLRHGQTVEFAVRSVPTAALLLPQVGITRLECGTWRPVIS